MAVFADRPQVVYEGEKLAARDGKVAFDALGAKFMATIRELQQHCAQLEAQTSGPQPTSPTPVSDGKAAAVLPTGDESADAHAARPSSHVASAIDHLTQMTQSLQAERTAVHRAGAHDWKLQRSRLVSEIKALGMNFEAAKRRIGTLEETVSDLNAAALKPCDYCADYEYKVVTMQEEVRVAEQTVRETELQVNKAIEDVQHRVDEATLRNSRHLKLSMDDLETRMAEKSHAQVSPSSACACPPLALRCTSNTLRTRPSHTHTSLRSCRPRTSNTPRMPLSSWRP
jgi:ABC-type uncharacterized transport system permease subunit